ncbi:MAG: HepT-like ribonuclease domain-containing protein [Candidatus Bathyarchaeia archaeon]
MPINIDQLKQRINEILESETEIKRLTSKSYTKMSIEEKYAVRYHIIVTAEALGSICLQIAMEDLKLAPQSYSECFKIMEKEGICDCAKDLIALMRLRNLLTHRYWITDDAKIYDSIKNNFKAVDRFLKSVKEKYAINV